MQGIRGRKGRNHGNVGLSKRSNICDIWRDGEGKREVKLLSIVMEISLG
jgi:hypothetical protein